MNEYHVIQIPADIKNPSPDRRSKDWHKLPVIPAGSRFIVGGDSIRSSGHRYAWEGMRSELAKLILAAGTPAEPQTVRELAIVHNCDFGGDEILRMLLKLGKVTAADFAAVGQAPEDF